VIGAISFVLPALAAPGEANAAAGGWEFDIVSYVWLSEVHGEIKGRNRSVDVDVDFDEIFDAIGAGDLFAAAGHFEARHGKLALFYDAAGVLAKDDSGGANFSADVKSMLVFFEFGAAYRIIGEAPAQQGTGLSSFFLEPIFGVRYTHNKNEFDVRIGEQTDDFDKTADFADPFLGGRIGFQIWEHFWWSFRGDVAPFGTGAEPGAWQIESIFRHQLPWQCRSILFDLLAGYRLLHFDYKPNRAEFDLTFRGPVVGLGVRF
jgi:hypothetical protein